VRVITPDDGYHYFFGYYDLRATDGRGRHLAHRVSFMDRLPTPDDVAELGILEDGAFTPFATTTAWNFQQGAMLQWHPTRENTVYYNAFADGHFTTVKRGEEMTYAEFPLKCADWIGRYAYVRLSVIDKDGKYAWTNPIFLDSEN
jgi:hypothetical protein